MKFVSYYTKNTPYERVMNTHLLPSLMDFQLDYHIEAIETKGDWYRNTSYKPTFILNCLNKFKEDVIFNDADAMLMRYPKVFWEIPKEYDLACHYLDWYLQWRGQTGNPKRELLSGTMLFRYNPKVLKLLQSYINVCRKNPTIWEQKILQELLEKNKDIKVYNLPPEYCTVIKHDNSIPKHINNPVIIHHQASRKYKKYGK